MFRIVLPFFLSSLLMSSTLFSVLAAPKKSTVVPAVYRGHSIVTQKTVSLVPSRSSLIKKHLVTRRVQNIRNVQKTIIGALSTTVVAFESKSKLKSKKK